MLEEYYAVLNLTKHAAFPEIESRYRQELANMLYQRAAVTKKDELAVIDCHIDRISEAFNFLKDPIARAMYDKTDGDGFQAKKTMNQRELTRIARNLLQKEPDPRTM